eukprot:SAG22_NODE_8387_length_660_cov_0.616756_1_plen_182_part_01
MYYLHAAPCNATDPWQLWAGKVLTAPGTVGSISNTGVPAGQCLSTFDLRPLAMRSCGGGDAAWVYNASTRLLSAAATSTHPHYCLNADFDPHSPGRAGFIELTSVCGPKCEQYMFVPTSAGAGLLKPVCPPAVPRGECPQFNVDTCLTVSESDAPPTPPTPPTAAVAGTLTLHIGANQMWGL